VNQQDTPTDGMTKQEKIVIRPDEHVAPKLEF
jgi:hypothetical protein